MVPPDDTELWGVWCLPASDNPWQTPGWVHTNAAFHGTKAQAILVAAGWGAKNPKCRYEVRPYPNGSERR
jgi:hypothetical protein